jgi:DNA polymerase-1
MKLQDEIGFNVRSTPQVVANVPLVTAELDDDDQPIPGTGISVPNRQRKTLKQYVDAHPIFPKIIRAQALLHASSTYGINWLNKNLEEDNLVYCGWNALKAVTGRPSAAKPNLQNIPVRDEEGIGTGKFREFFTSRYDGGFIIVSDVSQQEPRITAFLSGDERLRQAFETGEDVHQVVTDGINELLTRYGKEPITRKIGKAINLGIVYGKTAYGLAEDMGISEEEADLFISAYFQKFPDVKRLVDKLTRQGQDHGYVETTSGRRVYINPYKTKGDNLSVNAPHQGGAADMTKMALRFIYEECKKQDIPYFLTMVIHDEVVADVPNKTQAKRAVKIIEDAWIKAASILYPGMPFEVDTGVGESWAVKV